MDKLRRLYVVGGLIVASQCASLEAASAAGARRPHEGAWCARTNTGAGRVQENCIFDSFEACRRTVISGNRGFCSRNPRKRQQ